MIGLSPVLIYVFFVCRRMHAGCLARLFPHEVVRTTKCVFGCAREQDISHHDFCHASLQGLKPDDIGKC